MTSAARGHGERSTEGKGRHVGHGVQHVGGVVKHPHGSARGDCDARTRSILYGDGVGAAIGYEVELLDSRNNKVTSSRSGARALQAQVPRGLGSVGVRQGKGDISARERYIDRASDGLLKSGTKVDVCDVAPRGVVLTRCHKLNFEVAVSTSHLCSSRWDFHPSYRVAVIY